MIWSSGGKEFVAGFRDFRSAVRVRDGEFLVGSAGDRDQLHFSVSYPGNAIDPTKVVAWKSLVEEVLESQGVVTVPLACLRIPHILYAARPKSPSLDN